MTLEQHQDYHRQRHEDKAVSQKAMELRKHLSADVVQQRDQRRADTANDQLVAGHAGAKGIVKHNVADACPQPLEQPGDGQTFKDGDAYPGQRDEPADVKGQRASEGVQDKTELPACDGNAGGQLGITGANAGDHDAARDKADHRAPGTCRCQPASHQHAPGGSDDGAEAEGEKLEAADIALEGR